MKQIFKLATAAGISFIILALLLHAVTSGVDDQQRPGVLTALQNTSMTMVMAFLAFTVINLFVRAYRYRLLLQLSGESQVPTFKQMAIVTGIRNMVVDLLPARLGELGYVGLLNRGYGVKIQHCVSSLTVSVAFDLVALLIVVLMILTKQLISGAAEDWAYVAAISAFFVSVIAIGGLFYITPLVADWFASRYGQSTGGESKLRKWFTSAVELLQKFGDSIRSVREAGATLQVLLLSVVIRVIKYLAFYALFVGVALPSFPQLAELSVEKVVSALIGGELGASLPIPTFMSFGAYEGGSALMFKLLGVVDQAGAFITILCVHIWSQFVEYIIGGALLAFFILVRRKTQPISKASSSDSKPRPAWTVWFARGMASLVLLSGTALLAWELRAAKKMGAISAPDVGGVAENIDEWRELSKQHVSRLNGFVVFSSNRDGNHDIFRLELATFELSKVTEHPHTETYPRISPDGTKLVFSRSQQPWVSQRNTVAWDIVVKDLQTGEEQQVASNGTAPQWINNSEITYLLEATKVARVNIDTKQSSVIYQTGEGNKMPAGAQISNPKYNPKTGQLVFTGRQNQIGMNKGHWGTAITLGNQHQGLHNGCELSWSSDGSELYQVTPGGRKEGGGGVKIIRVDPVTYEATTLIDLAGEFTHEYWPNDSNDGEYFVFGASRNEKEHEHDTKDYEIFLWKKGSDPSKATRLTFHTGNDNWPDVYIYQN